MRPDWSISVLSTPLTSTPHDTRRLRCLQGSCDFEKLQARPKVHERLPKWAQRVPALQERIFIPDSQGNTPVEGDEDISEEFREMNIVVRMPHIYFI
ncbi:hypothetical protein HETIRDRAFT_455384 [Heterobasidion irregulare TC 32-1]|uniref:Uncharacterized protein n=1 Tax=Heterobasidion irregulare (strain TC 32-1) TaxID=747525 RepID=W4JQ57_HETIT|nr:uncharacterized protein HETIRDRAFT_455384 [Heterobasidion irregulare TC 32-1]ETW75668.1 hypothetical protein HETIRDRAFT_455384 [Heterobasidion irregulare TC 32-1]